MKHSEFLPRFSTKDWRRIGADFPSAYTVEREGIDSVLRAKFSDEIWAKGWGYQPSAVLTHMLLADYGDAYFDVFAALDRRATYADAEVVVASQFGEPFDVILDRFSGEYQCTEPLWICAESAVTTKTLPLEVTSADCDDEATAGFQRRDPISGYYSPHRIVRFSLDVDTRVEVTLTKATATFHACGHCDRETGYGYVGDEHTVVELDLGAGMWNVIVEPAFGGNPYFALRVVD